jgi:hypothetical protein
MARHIKVWLVNHQKGCTLINEKSLQFKPTRKNNSQSKRTHFSLKTDYWLHCEKKGIIMVMTLSSEQGGPRSSKQTHLEHRMQSSRIIWDEIKSMEDVRM